MELRRVVVTGLGALTPIGNNVQEYWDNLINGVSGAAPIVGFNTEKFKTTFACELKNFNIDNFMPKKDSKRLDPYAQYAMVAADEAIKDSALDLEKINLERAGIIWGSGIGGLFSFTEEVKDFAKGDFNPRFSPFFIPKMIADIAAGHLSIKYGFKGPNYATVSACASSTNAIADAFNYIRFGKVDVVLTGGSEAAVTEAGVGGFNAMKAISTRNDNPKGGSRPFDVGRDGFVMGDGAGALILEEYEHAKARGAKIYAEMVGAALTADAHHLTAPHPEGDGAARAMALALADANMKPEELDHVNTHGTSTPLGDLAETQAIERVFGEHAYKLSINSTKSMTGHLLGAAGAIETIAGICAMERGIVPPTINLDNRDPQINPNLDLTPNVAKKREINSFLNNNFGFGGHNVSLVFKKFKA